MRLSIFSPSCSFLSRCSRDCVHIGISSSGLPTRFAWSRLLPFALRRSLSISTYHVVYHRVIHHPFWIRGTAKSNYNSYSTANILECTNGRVRNSSNSLKLVHISARSRDCAALESMGFHSGNWCFVGQPGGNVQSVSSSFAHTHQ